MGTCNATTSHFYTRSGFVTLRSLRNMNHIMVQQRGTVSFTLEDGAVRCVAHAGSVTANVRGIVEDSAVQGRTGRQR